jgi:hypothetical protein
VRRTDIRAMMNRSNGSSAIISHFVNIGLALKLSPLESLRRPKSAVSTLVIRDRAVNAESSVTFFFPPLDYVALDPAERLVGPVEADAARTPRCVEIEVAIHELHKLILEPVRIDRLNAPSIA